MSAVCGVGPFLENFSRKFNSTMIKKNFKKQILIQNVQMDGSVNFQTNGDINVYPCPWESDKVVTNGNRVRYEGGIEVDADGRTRVKRWNRGSRGPMYETLFETAHASVKITREKTNRGRRLTHCGTIIKKGGLYYGEDNDHDYEVHLYR